MLRALICFLHTLRVSNRNADETKLRQATNLPKTINRGVIPTQMLTTRGKRIRRSTYLGFSLSFLGFITLLIVNVFVYGSESDSNMPDAKETTSSTSYKRLDTKDQDLSSIGIESAGDAIRLLVFVESATFSQVTEEEWESTLDSSIPIEIGNQQYWIKKR